MEELVMLGKDLVVIFLLMICFWRKFRVCLICLGFVVFKDLMVR